MITLKCDKCERVLEVPDDKAGTKVTCPACGDTNVVPGRGAPAATSVPTPPSAVEAERTLMVVRAAMFRAKPARYTLVMLLVVGGLVGTVVGLFQARQVVWIPSMIASVIGGVWWLVWKLFTLEQTLTVTSRRTIERLGLLRKETTEVMHDDIRNIQVRQSFAQRILSVGELGISSAAQDTVEIVAKDVPRPYLIRDTINKYRAVPIGKPND